MKNKLTRNDKHQIQEKRISEFEIGQSKLVKPFGYLILISSLALGLIFIPAITIHETKICLLYTSPSPRDGLLSRMPSSA